MSGPGDPRAGSQLPGGNADGSALEVRDATPAKRKNVEVIEDAQHPTSPPGDPAPAGKKRAKAARPPALPDLEELGVTPWTDEEVT